MEKFNSKKCDICEKEANSLCYECMMYFCDNCYKYSHEKKISNNHKKEKLDLFFPLELKCQEHPKNIINLFCIDEKGKNTYFLFIIYILFWP